MAVWLVAVDIMEEEEEMVVVRDVRVERRRWRWVWSGGEERGKESGVVKGVGDVRRVGGCGSRFRTREGKVWDWMSIGNGEGSGFVLTLERLVRTR